MHVGTTPADRMHHLIRLQTADGSWTLSTPLARMLHIERAELAAVVEGAPGDKLDLWRAWATALAIAWLELEVPDAVDQWRLLAAKARTWLDDSAVPSPDGRPWMELAREFLLKLPTR